MKFDTEEFQTALVNLLVGFNLLLWLFVVYEALQ